MLQGTGQNPVSKIVHISKKVNRNKVQGYQKLWHIQAVFHRFSYQKFHSKLNLFELLDKGKEKRICNLKQKKWNTNSILLHYMNHTAFVILKKKTRLGRRGIQIQMQPLGFTTRGTKVHRMIFLSFFFFFWDIESNSFFGLINHTKAFSPFVAWELVWCHLNPQAHHWALEEWKNIKWSSEYHSTLTS